MTNNSIGLTDYSGYIEAGGERSFNTNGDSYHIIEASSHLHLTFDDGKDMKRYQGMGGTAPTSYQKVTIKSEIAQNFTISLGTGTIFDSRSNISATLNTTISPTNLSISLPSVTIAPNETKLLTGANSDRKELRIGIKSDNEDGIFFGASDTSAIKQGGWIELGGVEYVSSEGAFYGYNPHPTESITVNLLDMKRV